MSKVKIGEITDSCLGKMLDAEKNKGEYAPYLANINVRWGSFDVENLSEMRFEENEQERYGLKDGDLVMCEGGEPGRCAIWHDQIPNMKIQKALHRIRPHDNVDIRWLYYWFLLYGRHHFLDRFFTETTIKHLPGDKLKEIELELPEKKVQTAIADVLTSLDIKIEHNLCVCAELESMAKTLYDYWFVQFDFPDENGKPYRTGGGKMKYSKMIKSLIPEGWIETVLSDIANITMGQSPSGESFNEAGEGEVFYQGSTDFGNRFPTPRVYTTAPSRFAKKGDILMSVRAPVGTLNIAMEDCCIGRGLSALNSKSGSQLHLLYVLTDYKMRFDAMNSNGTTFGSINKDQLSALPVVAPPGDVLNRFETIVGPIEKKIEDCERQNRCLAKLRDWLLPMLMNGQVTISDTDNERTSI